MQFPCRPVNYTLALTQRRAGNSPTSSLYLFNCITSIYNYIFTVFWRSHYNSYHIRWVIANFRHSLYIRTISKQKQTPKQQRITISWMQTAKKTQLKLNKHLRT